MAKTKKKVEELTMITRRVLSYCGIPEEVAETNSSLKEASCDTYVDHVVTSREDQKGYDDDFTLDNWIIDNWPSLEGDNILIHIDY